MESSDIKIIEVVGDAEKEYEFDDGLVFVHRDPTAREVINYKNSVAYRRVGADWNSHFPSRSLSPA